MAEAAGVARQPEAKNGFPLFEEKSDLVHSPFASLPHWAIVIVAFAYAIGFVIVSNFLDSFGVQDATREFLRLKYLQVGFYFLLFVGSLVALVISLHRGTVYQRERAGTRTPRDVPNPPYALIIGVWITFLVPIYLAVGFAEPQVVGRKSLPFAALMILFSIFGSARIYALAQKYGKRNEDFPVVYRSLYVLLLVVLLGLGIAVVYPFGRKLLEMLKWPNSLLLLNFVLFVYALGWMVYKATFPRPELSRQEKNIYMWARVAIGLPILYFCVLSFAHGIYPFMSVSKGGGYYGESEYVQLTAGRPIRFSDVNKMDASLDMVQDPRDVLPPELIESGFLSKPLVLIEETTASVYVADPNDPKVPPTLTEGGSGGVKCWTDFSCRPRVVEIQKTTLARIEHIPLDKVTGGHRPEAASSSKTGN